VVSSTGTVTTTATGLPMDTRSSPAVAGLATGYEIVYQTNYGHLATTGGAGVTTETYKIMRAGTSPTVTGFLFNARTSITDPIQLVPEFRVAYQTSSGVLNYDTPGLSESVSTGFGMNASPASANAFRYLP